MTKPHAIVIGAGFTGVAIAWDLTQRGFRVSVVERGPIANGTSGRTHGLLHSGARYAVNDQESAIECIQENLILRRIVPDAIEPNGGLFVAVQEEDLAYREKFIEGCAACGIPIRELTPQEVLRLEPNLNPRLLTAFTVPDATFDPLRLALAFAASAKAGGAQFYLYTDVVDLLRDGRGNVCGVKAWNRAADQRFHLPAEVVINATGAWVGQITAMAGVQVPITPTPGVMVAYDKRLTQRAINLLNEPGDGDIVLPQRRMMVVGTTSFTIEDPDYVPVYEDHVALMMERGAALIPALRQTRERGAYMATRPLIGATAPGRSISRTFKAYDHAETDGIEGLVTITGGKATTLRLMAEKTVDVVCRKFGIEVPCRTAETPLLSYRKFYQ
ncbi:MULTISPECIES: FAD-dependent oxidoreductase [Anaerolinea]|uniref:FAD dependent oxidoreductase family protein n=1 Tax=Anaerolinea thermophila (strain DSM 14523 / JCM 11388 / NBRC 100420 / UNI-1) TaxID=926569 RepID=E8N143_ANATU|nr:MULTISPECIES: FAD-dependent oxidoreductase [Anaerolinea]BAJ64786.1 FAD dependent oxidoreductase family protein [Anaerolinea thermophila UNI-1]